MALDYNTATKEEINDEMIIKYKQEQLESIENERKSAFYAAREAAIKTFVDSHDAAKLVMIAEWQAAEDNDYTIPQ